MWNNTFFESHDEEKKRKCEILPVPSIKRTGEKK
jgi:hypothetical protein